MPLGSHAQVVVLDDVVVRARAIKIERVGEVADDVAIGECRRADDVVMRAVVELDAVAAAVAVHGAGAGEADEVADDLVVVSVDAVQENRPVMLSERDPTDDVVGAGDEQCLAARGALRAADLDAHDCVRPVSGGVDSAPLLAVAVDQDAAGAVLDERRGSIR